MVSGYSVWKRIHELTGRKVEKRAIFELVSYIEHQIDEIIEQSEKELDKLNDLKRVQDIYQKVIIDHESVRNAIKTINSNRYSFLPERAGGVKKEGRNEKHPQMRNVLTEVV